MKFLANENFPGPSVTYLREKGFDVESISEKYSGISDEEVVEIAIRERRIILTFDSDYGEILFKYSLPDPPSVVYF